MPSLRKPLISLSHSEALAGYQALGAMPVAEPAAGISPPLGFAIAQLSGVYILAENAEGLVVVDMHAAHERITYEKLKTSFDDREIVRQPLLVPLGLSVSEREAELAEESSELFQSLGLDIDRSGPTNLVVREVPALLKQADVEKLVRDVLADLQDSGTSNRVEDRCHDILATMACHHSIRANRALTLPEIGQSYEKKPYGAGLTRASVGLPAAESMGAVRDEVLVTLHDVLRDLLRIVRDEHQIHVLPRDLPARQHRAANPLQKAAPVARIEEHHGEVADLARLNEGQRLEELVHRPEAAGEDDEGTRVLHEHRLAHEEVA